MLLLCDTFEKTLETLDAAAGERGKKKCDECFISDVPASAAYFASYELIQRAMIPEGGDRSQLGIGRTLFAGGMAGICNWIVALPPDVLKSRLQSGTLI